MPREPQPAMSDGSGPDGWPLWYQRVFEPYLGNSALLPVLLAALGHVWMLQVILLLRVVRDGDGHSWGVLLGALLVSVWMVSFERKCMHRMGRLSVMVISSWILSAALAWQVDLHGVY